MAAEIQAKIDEDAKIAAAKVIEDARVAAEMKAKIEEAMKIAAAQVIEDARVVAGSVQILGGDSTTSTGGSIAIFDRTSTPSLNSGKIRVASASSPVSGSNLIRTGPSLLLVWWLLLLLLQLVLQLRLPLFVEMFVFFCWIFFSY